MIDTLLAFTIFLLIMSLIPLTINHIIQGSETDKTIERMKWNIFVQQLKKEVRLSDRVNIENGKLIVSKNQQQIIYEKYGSNIRRRVDGTGHEIVLQNVDRIEYEERINTVLVVMTDLQEETHTSLITPFINGD
ncbi:competence type IV pilus minor pilin ComGF [Cytobacillus gottheilii]|uniref:competence type IV pilus minor pilin ComGF n=1 Tax=Cytobacillus gottheilii TaxID=859144 RepID=UPI0015932CB0|nr:competence type IV pilus minor pilin ComGF [Cytobacillus gottheilii]